jgi:hypothetical protein
MSRAIYRSLGVMVLAVLVSFTGCDKKDQERRSQAVRSAETQARSQRALSSRQGSQQSHSDVQLYEGIVERLRRENLELRRQNAQALENLKQMRQRIELIQRERTQAITGFKEVLDAAGQYKQDTAQKSQVIQELEQENQALLSTIADLTDQLDQVIIDSELSDTTASEYIEESPEP